MNNVEQRIQKIEESIQATCNKINRKRSDIHVVAVTKSVSSTRAQHVIDAGISHLGENRPEGLIQKRQDIQEDVVWHYIGNLQSRKVRDVINDIGYIHSLSRMSIAKEIQKRAAEIVNCFVQVNVSGEASKSGITPEALEAFINELAVYDKIRVVGLMTMAPNTEDEQVIRSVFKMTRELRDQIHALGYAYAPCTELSMGMSNDYQIAIEEGATYLRIGTALVGGEGEEG